VPGKVHLGAFRQQAFAAALPAPSKGCATTFRSHAGTETMLLFPGSLRSL